MAETVIVCDDEELIRWSLTEHLEQEGYRVLAAPNGKVCLDLVQEHAPDAVFLDLKMPVMDGLTALRTLRERDLDLPVIVITAHGGVESAIDATRLGAAGYLSKPFDLREASLALSRALAEYRLKREVHYLREEKRRGYGDIVGDSPSMQRLFEVLRRIERIDAPTVLVQGESGTGKDLVARSIHGRGPRPSGPRGRGGPGGGNRGPAR
jgi:DNA-binding NtrC family response regulator